MIESKAFHRKIEVAFAGLAPGSARVDACLLAILAGAAALRFASLDAAPPGINQDEALSAWNGWCLLKTGHALSGEPWPIFHCRNIGDYPTMLFFYLLIPFQWLFGLSVWSTRLPAALAGIGAVACAWDVGRRLAGPAAGRWAALAMALSPWSVFLGHFGTGASVGPLQALLPLSLLARSGLVPALDSGPTASLGAGAGPRRLTPPRWLWALLAGLAFGLGTYGFHSLRVQLPLTLAAAILVSPASPRGIASQPGARAGLFALSLGFLAPFLPLALVSLADPDSLRRWQMTRLWAPDAPAWNVVRLVAERWVIHFAPDFLFVRGDHYSVLNPARIGALSWWMLPGLLAGGLLLLARFVREPRARLLLALLALYPVGDLVSANEGVHSLRSAAGLPALALVLGFGTKELLGWLARRGRGVAIAATAVLLALAGAETARTGTRFFRDGVRDRTTQIEYQAALLEASRWLGPRLGPDDHVFCTTTGMNQPFVIVLVGLRYDPARWLADSKDVVHAGFDRYRGFGRFHFIYDDTAQAIAQALELDGRPERAWFLVRPGEYSMTDPVRRITAPNGEEMLWVCVRQL